MSSTLLSRLLMLGLFVVVAAVVGIANVVLVIPASAALSRAINIGPPRDLGAVSGGSAAR